MGTFGNSFSREIGKNTGKLVSNAVFGDKWSTPHRVTSTIKVAEIKAEQAKLEAEASRRKAQLEYDSQIDKIKLEQKFEKQKAEDSILDDIVRANFNTDKDSIFQVLTDLYSLSESTENQKIKKAAVEKIKAGIFKLEQIGAKVEADYFNNKFKEKDSIEEKRKSDLNLSLKKNQNLLFIGLGLFVLGLLFSLWKNHDVSTLTGYDYVTVKYPFVVFLLVTAGIIIVFIGVKKYLRIRKELNK